MTVPKDFLERHVWLCQELYKRRVQEVEADFGTRVMQDLMSCLDWDRGTKSSGPWRFFEIISDGGGQAEPYWYGLTGYPGRYGLLHPDERKDYANRIAQARSEMRGQFREFTTTHRELGRFFTDSIVFFVKGELTPVGLEVNDRVLVLDTHGVEAWLDIAQYKMKDYTSDKARDIEDSLKLLCKLVLWPQFFRNATDLDKFISIIYVHGSIVQSECGVWAMHLAAEKEPIDVSDPVSALHFIDPAEQCLNHVLVAEAHQSGLHRRRSADLVFVGRALSLCAVPPKSEAELYQHLNKRVLLRRWDDPTELDAHENLGHEVYTRELQADYLQDYGDMFHWTLSRLSGFHPDGLKQVDNKFLRATSALFAAKRIEELQADSAVASSLHTPSLRDILIWHALSVANSVTRASTTSAPTNSNVVPGWGEVLYNIASAARTAFPFESNEACLVNAGLWSVVCLCLQPDEDLPDIELTGSDDNWEQLLSYCRKLGSSA